MSAAAASRIRVDISDVSKLKSALTATQVEAKKLSDTLAKFDDRAIRAVRNARTEIERLQRALGSSGVSSATGPKAVAASSGGGIGAANWGAGTFSGSQTTMRGAGTSYTPPPMAVGGASSAYGPSVNLMPQTQTLAQRAGSYLTTPTLPGMSAARAQARTTPAYSTMSYLTSAATVLAGLGASHIPDATSRSYLLNQMALASGASSAQMSMGNRMLQGFGDTGLNYADYSQAGGILAATGQIAGRAGMTRMRSAAALSTINPLQGLATSAGQVTSVFTPQNYYALRIAGIQMNPNSQNIYRLFDQIISRLEGQAGRPLTSREIQEVLQVGTGMHQSILAMGISEDMMPNLVRYWQAKRQTGQRGSAAMAGVNQGTLYRNSQRVGAEANRAYTNFDRSFIPSAAAAQGAKAWGLHQLGNFANTPEGQALGAATGALGSFANELKVATDALRALVEVAIARRLLGAGGGGGIGGVGGAAGRTFRTGRISWRGGIEGPGGAGLLVVGAAATYGAQRWAAGMTKAINMEARANDQGAAAQSMLDVFNFLHARHYNETPEWKRGGWDARLSRAVKTGNETNAWHVIQAFISRNPQYRGQTYGISAAGGAAGGGASRGGDLRGASGGTARGAATARAVVHNAEEMLGVPYRWGGESARTGVDCSGLTQLAYQEAGISIPRVAADQQRAGRAVRPEDVAPGDLLFLGDPAHHVMMSIGGGRVIEAPHTGDVVKIINFPASAADGGIRRYIGGAGAAAGSGAIRGGSRTGGDPGDINNVTTSASAGLSALFSLSSGAALLAALSGGSGGAASAATAGGGRSRGGGRGPGGRGGGVGAAPSNPSGAAAIGKRLAAGRGWTGSQWDALYQLWMNESGWRVSANNPGSGAYGIPQALPGSKMATAGADWRTNPATQIKWGMDYIAGRYHDPVHALQFWNRTDPRPYPGHWYEKGAYDILRDEIAQLHKGEMVLPAGTAAKVRQLVETPQASQRGGGMGAATVPVQLVFQISGTATEQDARDHARRFAKFVQEDHDIQMVAAR